MRVTKKWSRNIYRPKNQGGVKGEDKRGGNGFGKRSDKGRRKKMCWLIKKEGQGHPAATKRRNKTNTKGARKTLAFWVKIKSTVVKKNWLKGELVLNGNH